MLIFLAPGHDRPPPQFRNFVVVVNDFVPNGILDGSSQRIDLYKKEWNDHFWSHGLVRGDFVTFVKKDMTYKDLRAGPEQQI